MDSNLKVTDQPQESSFYDLVSGDNVLSIPLFQRPYKWGKKNFDWLMNDVIDIQDDAAKSVFLGVIVCVMRGASPGRPIPWEVVDGQQRVTTLYLLLMSAAEILALNGHQADAAAIIGTYLLVRPLANNPVNTKLVPSFADRMQFKKLWDQVLAVPGLASDATMSSNPPKTPAPYGLSTGKMASQFAAMSKYLQRVFDDQGKPGIDQIVDITANRLSVVSISLRDPIVAPKIFERLNNRAELVTTADLVRNEVFSRGSDDPSVAQTVFETQWEPFVSKFSGVEGGLEKFLFPYGLILKPSVTKADLFSLIRTYWAQLSTPQDIINDLDKYVDAFLAVESGVPSPAFGVEINKQLSRIHRLGKPSSTYAFILRLCLAVKNNQIAVSEAVAILKVIEDFLFRRAICGIEPTGLHAVFKGLWGELMAPIGNPPAAPVVSVAVTAQLVRGAISSKPTVAWPGDQEFLDNIKNGDLYHRKVNSFAIREYDSSRPGDSPTDKFEIEHVLPQSADSLWQGIFGADYKKVLNTWANLVPLSQAMNPSVGAAQYATTKRQAFLTSMYCSARELATDCADWNPTNLANRADKIASWAILRWPTKRL